MPSTVLAATRRDFLAILAAAALLPACSTDSGSGPAPATRTVQHPLGTTEVPVAPTRVVALDRRAALPHLLALGVTPIAALTYESIIGTPFPPVIAEQARDVAVLPVAGSADDPNLEAVAALQPDLVIGWTGGIEEKYAALSAIAPTVAVDVDFTDASVSLRAIAAALGREAEADAVISAFDERRAARLREIGEIGNVSVVLGIGNQQFRVYQPTGSSVARWLAEAGGRIVPDLASAIGEPYGDELVLISPENLGQVTGDTIVVMHNTGAAGEAALAELEGSPLWPTLPAVRAGRVVKVNSQESVGSYGFQGYDSVLDTLVDQWTALGAR
ncbi:iron complex transport system substrate-binding protein [Pseudonocardia hierapolitana]|uniref:Iron complex transport system substrate-binding protein n=1 Tax=Pseudonocardia hierapolitana TaxID=1128676 RepID=A0A561SLE0_9PSEU|nr:ABC transporter substrate-binding protein [Pseudonocardia hierapolitana]TWF75680.1 iron complex transport system substrate-binding protein [Pseudonocardia hierapolitana]